MKIEFESPYSRIKGRECRSKLLDPNSELYAWIDQQRLILEVEFGHLVAPKRMDYHIELIGNDEKRSEELLNQRARKLHNRKINPNNFQIFDEAWVLETPDVDGYGPTHITIGYFPNGIPDNF